MDLDASRRKTPLTRPNQRVRSATDPAAQPPVEDHLPGFDGATGWHNSPPPTTADLRGRVVPVNCWTSTCINWLRTLPYIRAWAREPPRLRTHRQLRLPHWLHPGHQRRLRRPETAGPQPLGACR